jgi:hypothetical protein
MGIGLALAVLGGWVGLSAQRARARLTTDATRLESDAARLEQWRREFRPVSATEATSWRLVDANLASLGVAPSERVTVAERVARAAEEAGMVEVRVRFTAGDSNQAVQRMGARAPHPASYGLTLNARGSYEGLVRLIGALPTSVAVWRVTSTREGGAIAHALALAVFEAVDGNGSANTTIRSGGDDAAAPRFHNDSGSAHH